MCATSPLFLEVVLMRKRISLLLVLVMTLFETCFLTACSGKPKLEKFTEYYFDYFDTATSVVGYGKDREEFDAVCEDVKAQLLEYHRLFTIYSNYEGLNNLYTINQVQDGVHTEVQVDQRIIDMLTFAKEMYQVSGGRVNIAMGSVLKIWHVYRNEGLDSPSTAQLPPMERLEEAAMHTNIDDLIIDDERNTVFLADPEMFLDVGAIAKGYAAERVAEHLEEQGVTGYLLNVGGNVRSIGEGNGKPWNVGIDNPDTEDEDHPFIEYLHLSGESLVTSGTYQRFYVVDGKSYHHIIDPDTLMPGTKYSSVSVLTEDSGLGDAMSTALFLMDYEEGKALVESMDDLEAMWVLPDGEQRYSEHFQEYTYVPKSK